MIESRFSMVHVRLTSDRPFADVKAAFDQKLEDLTAAAAARRSA
jgi:hypothetical protein